MSISAPLTITSFRAMFKLKGREVSNVEVEKIISDYNSNPIGWDNKTEFVTNASDDNLEITHVPTNSTMIFHIK